MKFQLIYVISKVATKSCFHISSVSLTSSFFSLESDVSRDYFSLSPFCFLRFFLPVCHVLGIGRVGTLGLILKGYKRLVKTVTF